MKLEDRSQEDMAAQKIESWKFESGTRKAVGRDWGAKHVYCHHILDTYIYIIYYLTDPPNQLLR